MGGVLPCSEGLWGIQCVAPSAVPEQPSGQTEGDGSKFIQSCAAYTRVRQKSTLSLKTLRIMFILVDEFYTTDTLIERWMDLRRITTLLIAELNLFHKWWTLHGDWHVIFLTCAEFLCLLCCVVGTPMCWMWSRQSRLIQTHKFTAKWQWVPSQHVSTHLHPSSNTGKSFSTWHLSHLLFQTNTCNSDCKCCNKNYVIM